jgi:hypothetical protein
VEPQPRPTSTPQPAPARSGPALIINTGTLPGLVASWAEGVVRAGTVAAKPAPTDTRCMVWFPHDDRPARARRRDAVIRQVDLCSLAGMSERNTLRFDCPTQNAATPNAAALPEHIGSGAKTTAMLLSAAIEAASFGFSRVIWPVHAGAAKDINTDNLADICDRALLAGQLIGLDLARAGNSAANTPLVRGVRIETPYADLTDAELMDLALDMDVPLHACWWCLNEDERPCAHCSGCMRWREALVAVDPAGRLDIQVLAAAPIGTHAMPKHK